MVSVRLMTYMHEAFITEAMNGIMQQKTTFNVEVVVGDDFSTDRTLEIIKKYQDTDTIKIKILTRKRGDAYSLKRQANGRLQNFVDILNNCQGKYIALLDGDDYWTDPLKLQKQVDFLESNSSFSAVFTDIFTLKNSVIKEGALKEKHKRHITKNNITDGFWIPTPTVLFNTLAIKNKIPKIFTQAPNGDFFLFYILAQHGPIGYLDLITAVYRQHSEGLWAGTNYINQINARIKTFKTMCIHFNANKIYLKKFKQFIFTNNWLKFKYYNNTKAYLEAFKMLVYLSVNNPIFTIKQILKKA